MACFRHHRMLYRSSFIIALALLIALQAGTPAWAWGRLGHRVISRHRREEPDTRKPGPRSPSCSNQAKRLADASTLGRSRTAGRLPKTAPWHYVDVPLDEPEYDSKWSADDPKNGCVVDKINEFRTTLKDKTKSVEDRRFALRFLIHCVEDMHMPMHVGDNHDRGGNDTQVQFFDRGTNMHSLWDSGMIERVSYGRRLLAQRADGAPVSSERGAATQGNVDDWATESLLAARQAYVNPATGQRIKPGTMLGLDYHNRNIPLVKERMYLAGIRLAKVLNDCFP